MKKIFDWRNWGSSIRILIIIIISIFFYKFMDNSDGMYKKITDYILAFSNAAKPFLLALIIAYIFNPVVELCYDRIFKRIPIKDKKNKRIISTFFVYVILILIIVWMFVYILPEIVNSISELVAGLPDFIVKIEKQLLSLNDKIYSGSTDILTIKIAEIINSFFRNTSIVVSDIANNAIVGLINFTSSIILIVFSLVISAYFIVEKDAIVRHVNKAIRAIFGVNVLNKYMFLCKEMNHTFVKYILGKSFASFILAIMCFIGLLILNSPYAILISVIFGITNMIPYFGPFFGELVGTLLIAFINPWMALWVFLLLFILQLFDAFYLTPKILGDTLGISPIWIMFSIILGGKIFGIMGMFFGAPLMAVIIGLVNRNIDKRIKNI